MIKETELKIDDQGNIIELPDLSEPEIPTNEQPEVEIVSLKTQAILIEGDTGGIREVKDLENRIETFLNTSPQKEIVSMSMSSLGIKHYVLILYREGT